VQNEHRRINKLPDPDCLHKSSISQSQPKDVTTSVSVLNGSQSLTQISELLMGELRRHQNISNQYETQTNQMHTFQINTLIRFLTPSSRFEPHGFINRTTVCTRSFCMVCFSCRVWDSAVGIATRYGRDGPGIESRWRRDFPRPSRPALGPTQPSYTMGTRSFPWVKRPGRGADHPPHLAPRLKEE
jgi:hypothetical protein